MPSSFSRLTSALVCGYVRHSPIEKGKWRLLKWASSFLVLELEPGTFVRLSGSTSDSVEAAIVRRGIIEPEDVRFFLSLLEPGMTVFDMGANLGMYTVLAARRVRANGSVHAFEPTPEVASRFKQNVAINGLANVVVNQKAVAAAEGTATLHLQAGSDLNTLAPGTGTPIEVQTVTLDGYVTAAGLARVDVMKVDVEGAEVMALRGGGDLLSGHNAPAIMIEFNPNALRAMRASVEELFDLLTAHGYRCYRLHSYGEGACGYSNVLAVKLGHCDHFRISLPRRQLSSSQL